MKEREKSVREGREMRQNGHKKKTKGETLDSDQFDEQIGLRLRWLTINEMEHEHKMRSKAIRLSRKRKKQVDSWII